MNDSLKSTREYLMTQALQGENDDEVSGMMLGRNLALVTSLGLAQ